MNNISRLGLIASAAVLASALSAPASATVWNFYSLYGKAKGIGPSHTWTQGSESVFTEAVSYGGSYGVWKASTAPSCAKASAANPCLWVKGPPTKKGDEAGLGLAPDPDKEIFFHDGIAFSTSSVVTGLEFSSVQHGESWDLEGCKGSGPCKLIAHGVGGTADFVTVTSAMLANFHTFVVDVPCAKNTSCLGGKTNSDNNILLVAITTTTGVPEPATLGLLALGLAGVGLARRRKS